MKKNVLIILIATLSVQLLKAQPVTFQQVDSILSIYFCTHQTNDGGYITGGVVHDPSAYFVPGCLLKLDSNGNKVWSKKFSSDSLNIYVEFSEQTSDGGYILAGELKDTASAHENYVIKTDASGNMVWSTVFGNGTFDFVKQVHQTSDGGYIVVGYVNSGNQSFLVKLNSSGIVSWSKKYNFSVNDQAYSVKQTNDGGFILLGITQDSIDRIYLIKADGSGNTQWAKTYSGADIGASSVEITNDGGFLLTGYIEYKILLFKTDNNGNLLWSKKYGNPLGWGNHAVQTNDGGYIITGALNVSSCFLAKTDSLGNYSWAKTYRDTLGNSTQGCFVNQTSDNGYIVSALTNINFNMLTNTPLYLIKTDANGNSGCNEKTLLLTDSTVAITVAPHSVTVTPGFNTYNIIITESNCNPGVTQLCNSTGIDEISNTGSDILIYPNPTTSQFTITLNDASTGSAYNAEIKIINLLGECVLQPPPLRGGREGLVDIGALSKGIYFVEVITKDKQVMRSKIVKQ